MQILANALPGFRDLRGPAIAGYTWLLFIWLALAPDLDHRPQAGVAATAFDLADDIGAAGIAIAVSVAAYLVGSVSQELSSFLRGRVGRSPPAPRWLGGIMDWGAERRGSVVDPLIVRGEELIEAHLASLDDDSKRRLVAERLLKDLGARAEEAARQMAHETSLPATLLVGDRPDLFAEVDRLRAEGELRLTVAPPVLALSILLAVEGSPWWALAVPAAVVLFQQGVRRDLDSRKVIADAVQLGVIESSSIARFAEWVERLPQEVDRLVELAAQDSPQRQPQAV